MGRIFCLPPKTLYHWYRYHLSDYYPDKESGKWHPNYLEEVDRETGEIQTTKPLYVFKPDNIGPLMSIDDKHIGGEGFTILSNTQTGKIAMMLESCKSGEVSEALSLFGDGLRKIRSISCDMAACYLSVCNNCLPSAKVVIDKFHVMQYVYDAVLDMRTRIKKELSCRLSRGKVKTEQDKQILRQLDLLKHCRYRLTQSEQKWSQAGKEVMEQVFALCPELKEAYRLGQAFKQWYDSSNCRRQRSRIAGELYKWYTDVKTAGVKEFKTVVKMIRKHEYEILNYFIDAHTNAKAERLNGKINRFFSNNYGMRDRDFALFRVANYFS